ncbi:MAG: adenylosuccinate synthase [Acidobacteriota bacterium]
MASIVVLGGQWGDEGKGKVVDLLTEHVDICARFAGGHNAGHTVKVGDTKYPLHLVPCGILRPNITCVIGNGVVVEPKQLVEEIEQLARQGIEVQGRLWVSDRAQVVLPPHPALDRAKEALLADGKKIGTTSRGIGPAYSDKASRVGLRLVDLDDDDGPDRLEAFLRSRNELLVKTYGAEPLEVEEVLETVFGPGGQRDQLRPYVKNTAEYLYRRLADGASLLAEGAQGALLDLDHGTYPFVTSSSATAGGACTGLGIPPTRIDAVFGVFKAYTTRVGGGPFPTELLDDIGDTIRERGHEYGTTTGRPRRVGWFDAVAARHAVKINGISSIALTLLDVLDAFEELKVCTAYRHRGQALTEYPSSLQVLAECEPVYRTMKGWNTPLSEKTSFNDFPPAAREYVELLAELLKTEIALVSVGPERRRSIRLESEFFEKLGA